MTSHLCAVISGGDWYDASVDHIVLPESCDIEAARLERESWYENEYRPKLGTENHIEYLSLSDWLIEKCGGRYATDDDLLILDDTI